MMREGKARKAGKGEKIYHSLIALARGTRLRQDYGAAGRGHQPSLKLWHGGQRIFGHPSEMVASGEFHGAGDLPQ